jgi:hypothetical protein
MGRFQPRVPGSTGDWSVKKYQYACFPIAVRRSSNSRVEGLSRSERQTFGYDPAGDDHAGAA